MEMTPSTCSAFPPCAPHAIDCSKNGFCFTNRTLAKRNSSGTALALAAGAAERALLLTFIAIDKSQPGRAAGSA